MKCNLTLILCRKPELSNLPSQEQVCFNETKEIKTAVEKIECRIETERECQENVVNKCKEVYSDIQCEKVSLLGTYLIQFLLLDSSLPLTASLSHLMTMLPKSSSCPKPAQRPNHAT